MEKDGLIIKRGYIYEFEPKTEYKNKAYALAVSSDSRAMDNIVSIIILSKNYQIENIEIVNSQFEYGVMYCNCGKITHSERTRLVREVSKVSEKKMEKIDRLIAQNLGLNPLKTEAENIVYKELYHELLEKMVGGKNA